jgi:hypothetical protein
LVFGKSRVQRFDNLFGRETVFGFDEKRRCFVLAAELILHHAERNLDARARRRFISADNR